MVFIFANNMYFPDFRRRWIEKLDIVRLGVVSVAESSITWMDLLCGGTEQQNNEEEYLATVNWMHGNILTAQILNRHHTKIKIVKFDIRTSQRKNILVEENSSWINIHDYFTPLDKGVTKFSGGFSWASEKIGFRHLCPSNSCSKVVEELYYHKRVYPKLTFQKLVGVKFLDN
ncbi:hypothetical protein JHK87_055155 [Glycine soja]|nr:hypothetical protein JHK87_055155 [Glycine soja]